MSIELWFLPAFLALLLWGAAVFLPKMAVARLPPMAIVVYQAAGYALFALGILLWEHGRIEFETRGVVLALVVGVLAALAQVFYVTALRHGDVTLVSVVTSLYPGIAVLLAVFILDERVTLLQGAGIIAAIGGLASLVLQDKGPVYPRQGWFFPALAALVLWGFWGFIPKLALRTLDPVSILVYETIGYCAVAIVITGIKRFRIETHLGGFLICMTASAMGSAAFLLYIFALKHGPVSIISVMTALYPAVTLLLARGILKEKLSRMQLAGVAVAFASILMMVV